MNFEALKRRVERGEQLVAGRAEQTLVRARATKTEWRDAWTPGRIVIVGLISGFAMGRSDPSGALRKLGTVASPRWLQAFTAVTGLVASLQAAVAAATAGDAAETADVAADNAQQAVANADGSPTSVQDDGVDDNDPMRPRSDRSRPDPVWTRQPPAAAEAATDVSER